MQKLFDRTLDAYIVCPDAAPAGVTAGDQPPLPRPKSFAATESRLKRPLGFAASYLLAAEVSRMLSPSGHVVSFWLALGLFLFTLVMLRFRDWQRYATAAIIAHVISDGIFHGVPVFAAVGIGVANVVAATSGAMMICRFADHPFRLDRPFTMGLVVTASTIVAAPLGALVVATVARLMLGESEIVAFATWWSAAFAGVLLTLPAMLIANEMVGGTFKSGRDRRLPEVIAILGVIAIVAAVVFGGQDHALGFLIAPFLVWMAFRFEVGGVAGAMAVIAIPAIWCTGHGFGPYADLTVGLPRTLALNTYLGVNASAFLLLAAVIRQRGRIATEVGESEARYRDLIENISDMVHSLAPNGKFIFTNHAWRETLGYSEEDTRDLSIFQIIHFEDRVQSRDIFRRLMAGDSVGRIEVRFVTKNGAIIYVEGHTNVRFENGKPVCTRAIFRDVTESRRQVRLLELARVELEEANVRLRQAACTDGLTHLNNRAAFQKKITEEVGRAGRYKQELSLIMIDVDHFKQFNDTFGHAAGDDALIAVARMLQEIARSTDFVARYGGEEFALILPHTEDDGALVLAERIRKAIADTHWPLRPMTVSVGVSTLNHRTPDGMSLVKHADEALYHCKRAGRNCAIHFDTIADQSDEPRTQKVAVQELVAAGV